MTTAISKHSDSDGERSFSKLHLGVQKAIFKLGWKELHSIQTQCIETIIGGTEHLLVCAQTAGGKTEAAFLPIISRVAQNPRPSVQVLYVGPLVALINDQFQRLETLCSDVDIPVHRWHGGVSATAKRRFQEAPGGILLITPESLESNFINYGSRLRRIYADLEFIVIDELHSFLSNVRGVHLRSLLARLSAVTGKRPRMIGLSATLGDPEGARSFLSPKDASSVTIIEDQSSKRGVRFGIRAYLRGKRTDDDHIQRLRPDEAFNAVKNLTKEQALRQRPFSESENFGMAASPDELDELDDIAEDILRTCSAQTNLVFANAKQGLEILADRLHSRVRALKWPRDPFYVHHGSLSRDLREETEAILKSGEDATVLCSSTLEMGIDIGSVRRVAQLDPPWSVASMLQRLGRSGRREGEIATLRMYSRDQSPNADSSITDLLFPNLLRSIALARLMLAKWLEPHDRDRLHLSTLVHQILSCLRQGGGMKALALHSALVANGAFSQVSQQIFTGVLRSLAAHGLIEQVPQGELILAPNGERITAGRDFYAAFSASEEFSVRCDNQEIGKLQTTLIPPIGENMILAGRRWRVNDIVNTAKTVFVSPTRSGKPPWFAGAGGELHNRIVQEMATVLADTDEPAYLDSEAQILLKASREFARRVGVLDPGFIVRTDSIQWFPWVGSKGLLTLELHARCNRIECGTDGLSITYRRINLQSWAAHLQSIVLNERTPLQLAQEITIKTFDKFDETLTDELLDQANAHDRIDPSTAVTAAVQALQSIPRSSIS